MITFLFLLRHFSATSDISELFEIWCTEHGKSYSSAEEKLYRLGVFADNYEFVTHHNNQENSSYTLSLNAYADITHHEFKAARLGLSSALRSSRPVSPQEPYLHRDVPESLDWRKKGAVTAVKDQGSCGMFNFCFRLFCLVKILNLIELFCSVILNLIETLGP